MAFNFNSFMAAGGSQVLTSGLSSVGGIVTGGQQNRMARTQLEATREQTAALRQQAEIEKLRLQQLQSGASAPPPADQGKENRQKWLWWGLGIAGTVISAVLVIYLTKKRK